MTEWPYVATHPDGALLTVWVVPGASRTEVVGVYADAIKIRVAAPAEGGKANRAVRRLLEQVIGRTVELVGGEASRRKQILVIGGSPIEVVGALQVEAGGT